ncbi:MAG: VOC family protein [Candidatus Eremiobacteraeota bacterium]|nr:VOC family protein [Candidatus Eremiobacteraeota bacterium]
MIDSGTRIKEIAFTAYPAENTAELAKFYTDVLGLKMTYKYEEQGVVNYAEFQLGQAWFSLMNRQWMDSEKGRGIGVAFEVDDIDAMLAELGTRGVKTEKPYDTPVCRVSTIEDPEGNRVTFHQTTVPH